MLKLPEERRRWGESKGAPSLKGYYFYSPQSSTVIKSKMAATTVLRTRTRFCPPKIRLQCRLIRTFLVQIGKNAKNKARADKVRISTVGWPYRFITLLHFLYMAVNRIVTLLFYCLELYFSCILVRVRVQFYFERVHYLFLYLIDVYISLINVLILLCVIFLTYMCCPWLCSHGGWLLLKCSAIGIGFNGAESNCGIAHILGILLMNNCDT